ILSQDQTLMLNDCFSSPVLSGFPDLIPPFPFGSGFLNLGSLFSEFSFRSDPQRGIRTFGIFRVALLFICQGSCCRFERQL
ncbi:MAG: hypothetical protein IJ716_16850, partial [Lachnospiraceae bacterium]|nr:hypothetical protein [Lachnospiraceae bacterium]